MSFLRNFPDYTSSIVLLWPVALVFGLYFSFDGSDTISVVSSLTLIFMKLSFEKKSFAVLSAVLFTFSSTFSASAAVKTVRYIDLPSVEYTHGSLANPHTVRVGDLQARYGRIATLERVYDTSGSSAIKKKLLDQATKLFKKGADTVSENDIIPLVTAEKALYDAKKFKQRLRIWEVAKPKQSITVDLPVVFDASTPQVVDPIWILGQKNIVVMQDSADHNSNTVWTVDFKSKKLKKMGTNMDPGDFPVIDDVIGATWSKVEGKESIAHEVSLEDDQDTGEYYQVGTFTITDAKGNDSVARYPIGDYEIDFDGNEDQSNLNPLVIELGSAGYYLQTYTAGMFVVRQGETPTENIMNNQMPKDVSSLDQLKKLINQQWAKPEAYDFATYQVVGYRLRK